MFWEAQDCSKNRDNTDGLSIKKSSYNKIKNNSRIVVAKACQELGVPYKVTKDGSVIINNKVIFGFMRNNINTRESCRLANNKYECSEVLRMHNIPVPACQYFDAVKNKADIEDIISRVRIDYPLVVKPVCGTNGINVHLNIKNKQELRRALSKFINFHNRLVLCDEIIIEEYFAGECYRVLAYEDNIIDVMKKEMPYVVGDGVSPLKTLIKRYDRYRVKNGHHSMDVSWKLMRKYNVNPNTVLPIGFRLSLIQICGCGIANYLKVDMKDIHPSYIDMFKRVNGALGLTFSGIDVLIKDIRKPNQARINEVNSAPALTSHYFRDTLVNLEKYADLEIDNSVGVNLVKQIMKYK